MSKVALIIPVYNEERIIRWVLERINGVDHTIVVDDCSTDNTPAILKDFDIHVVRHSQQEYIGSAIRDGVKKAKDLGCETVVIMAGNGKDDPQEIPRLLEPIKKDGYDFVQGSRYLPGGAFGKMPLHRTLVTRIYPLLIRLFTGKRTTDATNGFRALRLSILEDPRIDISQRWLDECLEYYLTIRVYQCGFRSTEVPVSKIYPQTKVYSEYTKVRPGIGWLKRMQPLFFCGLGLRS